MSDTENSSALPAGFPRPMVSPDRDLPAANALQDAPISPVESEQNRSKMCQGAPEPSASFQPGEKDKTNPTPTGFPKKARPAATRTPRPLTDRQLAATRLIVRGLPVGLVARHLGVERHAIARWHKNPLFNAELARLRRMAIDFAVTAGIPKPSAPPTPLKSPPAKSLPKSSPPPRQRFTPTLSAEDRECEAMISKVLGLDGKRDKNF